MGLLLFAIALSVIGEVLWFKFYRDGKKEFTKYDKEHSNVTVINTEEITSKLNKASNFVISDIISATDKVSFNCNKNSYTINIENGTAYVEYDMSGFEFRMSKIGRLKKRFKYLKSAHKAIIINMIMDTFQNYSSSEQNTYEKTKAFAKASVIAFIAALLFAVVGIFTFWGSVSNDAISDAKMLEYCSGVTYEELIDTYIKDAEWSAFNGERDIAVVEVNGISIEGEKICIQFWGNLGMGLSYNSLSLEFFEADGVSLDPDEAMNYIYWYYY